MISAIKSICIWNLVVDDKFDMIVFVYGYQSSTGNGLISQKIVPGMSSSDDVGISRLLAIWLFPVYQIDYIFINLIQIVLGSRIKLKNYFVLKVWTESNQSQTLVTVPLS